MHRITIILTLALCLVATTAGVRPRLPRVKAKTHTCPSARSGTRTSPWACSSTGASTTARFGHQPFAGRFVRGLRRAILHRATEDLQAEAIRSRGLGGSPARRDEVRHVHDEAPQGLLHVRHGDDRLRHHEHALRQRHHRRAGRGVPEEASRSGSTSRRKTSGSSTTGPPHRTETATTPTRR